MAVPVSASDSLTVPTSMGAALSAYMPMAGSRDNARKLLRDGVPALPAHHARVVVGAQVAAARVAAVVC